MKINNCDKCGCELYHDKKSDIFICPSCNEVRDINDELLLQLPIVVVSGYNYVGTKNWKPYYE